MFRFISILCLACVCRAGNLYEALEMLNATTYLNWADQAGLDTLLKGVNGESMGLLLKINILKYYLISRY